MAPTLVTITTDEETPSGENATGYITFRPNTRWRFPDSNDVIPQVTVRRNIVAGAFDVALQLIATDSPGITIDEGSTPRYRVERHVHGGSGPEVSYIQVPAVAGTLSLADAPDVGP